MQPRFVVILSLETLFNKFQIGYSSQAKEFLKSSPKKISQEINRLVELLNSGQLSVFDFYNKLVSFLKIDIKDECNSYEKISRIPTIVNDKTISVYLYSFDPSEVIDDFPEEENIFQKGLYLDNQPYITQIKKIVDFLAERTAVQAIYLFLANQSPFEGWKLERCYPSFDNSRASLVYYCEENNIQGYFLTGSNIKNIFQSFKEWCEIERVNFKSDNFKQTLYHLSKNMHDRKALDNVLLWSDLSPKSKECIIKDFIEIAYDVCHHNIYHKKENPDDDLTQLTYLKKFIHHIQFMFFLKENGLLDFKNLRLGLVTLKDDKKAIEIIQAELKQLKAKQVEIEDILMEEKPTVFHLPAKPTPRLKFFKTRLKSKEEPTKAYIISLNGLFNQFWVTLNSEEHKWGENKPHNVSDTNNTLLADFNAKKISVHELYKQLVAMLGVNLDCEANAYSRILKIPDIANNECFSLYLYNDNFQQMVMNRSYFGYYDKHTSTLSEIKNIVTAIKDKEPSIKEINLYLGEQSIFTPKGDPEIIRYCEKNSINVFLKDPPPLYLRKNVNHFAK